MDAEIGDYAVVENGMVVNTAVWDGVTRWPLPDGQIAVRLPEGSPVSVGWAYDKGIFTAVSIPSPPTGEEGGE